MAGEAGIPAHRYGHIADPGYELGFSYTGKVKLKLCAPSKVNEKVSDLCFLMKVTDCCLIENMRVIKNVNWAIFMKKALFSQNPLLFLKVSSKSFFQISSLH